MKKASFITVLSVLAASMIMGCACNQPSMLQSSFKPQMFETVDYQPKVDNFMLIFDASGSMSYCYKDSNRMNTAKAIVSNMNRSLPEMPLKAGLRSFGHSLSVSEEKTVLIYGLAAYTTSGFQSGLDKITVPGGLSPMAAAIDGAEKDLASAVGKIALIIVSDGESMREDTIASVKRIKDHFNERLCIYTIHVGDNAAGGVYLSKLAKMGGCGYAKADHELTSGPEMFAFVKDVFLENRMDADQDGVFDDQDTCPNTPAGIMVDARGCPMDADNDGVYDNQDACPNTPANVSVNAKGCPLDSDGDGIVDYMDNCPGTPKGTQVDYSGCPSVKATKSAKVTDVGTWLYEDIKFDTGSAKIKAASYPVLDEIAVLLTGKSGLKVEIQGHTDSAGSLQTNLNLSKNRAKSVEAYLLRKGVSSDQLTTEGYGPSRPIASNASAAGRAKNRRVELKPIK
ncbi:MAG: OmpA family protein [Desulfobacterales bacterium]|nr:OmpA family protein [Desulfobacterales bacterium]